MATMAEALNISPAEVERLLAQVRGQRNYTPPASPVAARTFGDRSAALSAGLALALVVVVAIFAFGGYLLMERRGDAAPPPGKVVEVPPRMRISGPGGQIEIEGSATTPAEAGEATATVPEAPKAPPAPSMNSTSDAIKAEDAHAKASEEQAAQARKTAEEIRRSVHDALEKANLPVSHTSDVTGR